jgi:hypothetical protein
MLDIHQDTFIAQYVTTWMANYGYNRYKMDGGAATKGGYPIKDALMMARIAWYSLMDYGIVMPRQM